MRSAAWLVPSIVGRVPPWLSDRNPVYYISKLATCISKPAVGNTLKLLKESMHLCGNRKIGNDLAKEKKKTQAKSTVETSVLHFFHVARLRQWHPRMRVGHLPNPLPTLQNGLLVPLPHGTKINFPKYSNLGYIPLVGLVCMDATFSINAILENKSWSGITPNGIV